MHPIIKSIYLDALGRQVEEVPDEYYTFLNKYRHVVPFEILINNMLTEYKSIFPDRRFALNHLYCVIGNGYEWANGGLVHIFPESTPAEREARKRQREEHKKLMDAVSKILPISPKKEIKFKPYDIHEGYSRLCTIPDNARKDYIAGAFEAINLIKEYSAVPEQIKLAQKTEASLYVRFQWI